MSALLLIDLALGCIVVGLAWRLLATPDPFKSVVLFIAFGLLMAFVWARLGSTDLALAEAAIGAGVTGALFLAALGALKEEDRKSEHGERAEREHAGPS